MLNKIDLELKLKLFYIIIIIIEIPLGLIMLLTPDFFMDFFQFPAQDPIIYGVAASIWLAFGVISILALRNPEKFIPILLFQFIYKCIWFIGVIVPAAIAGPLEFHAIVMIIIFAGFVIGDIIVIPWNTVFEKKQ